MKSSLLIIALIVVIVVVTMSSSTIEGATSDVISIRQSPYSFSFIRPYTYKYTYPFAPIVDYTGSSPQVFTIDPNLPVYYHFGIILDRSVADNRTEKTQNAMFNTMDKNLISANKVRNRTAKSGSIVSKTVIFSPAQFPLFISKTKITDAAVVMRLYDLVETAYKKFLLTKQPTSFSVQQVITIPANYTGDATIFIQRAINYPPTNSTVA